MHNLKGFLRKFKKHNDIYNWTPISEAFLRIIKHFIKREDKILEFGSSTGHISYRLAQEGYMVTLLEIRKEPVEIAKDIFKRNNIKADIICADIFNYNEKCDIVWNSGLIQCYDDNGKERLIKKLADITYRILLFYPDVENPDKKIGTNEDEIPGVADAKEYTVKRIPEIMYSVFNEIYNGILEGRRIGLEYNMYWIHGSR